jgi:hypothetical protein
LKSKNFCPKAFIGLSKIPITLSAFAPIICLSEKSPFSVIPMTLCEIVSLAVYVSNRGKETRLNSSSLILSNNVF